MTNKCPECGKPHAFSIMSRAEVWHYSPAEYPPALQPGAQGWNPEITAADATLFYVYICPKSETGFVVVEGDTP